MQSCSKRVMFDLFCFFYFADVMVGMGYNLEEIQDSLAKMKYDEITATYLLLGRKASEVQTAFITLSYSTSTNLYSQVSREESGCWVANRYVTPVSRFTTHQS